VETALLKQAKTVTVADPVAAQAIPAVTQTPANSRPMQSAIRATKIAALLLVNLLEMELFVVQAQESATLKRSAVAALRRALMMILLQMEHLVEALAPFLAPLVNALPVTFNAKHSWDPIHKGMIPTPVPPMVARYPALLPNSAPMFVILCNKISSMVHHARVEESVTMANVRARVLGRRLRAG